MGVVAFGLLLLDGVIARIIPLTDGTWPRFMLLAAPVAAVVAAIHLRVDARAARTEAGRWIGQPALLLAAESDRTSLSPLVASRAREGAPTATPPARTVDGWARSAALLLVPAIVAAFAPGRTRPGSHSN